MYAEKELNELDLARTVAWGDSPTFSKDVLTLPSIIDIGIWKNFVTYFIKISESDKVLEYEKTSENFSKFWKNKHLNEIGVRNDYFSTISTVHDSFSGLTPPKELEMKKDFFKEIMLRNWIDPSTISTRIILPPITGFDTIKKSELEQFLEDLSTNFEITNLVNLKGIFAEISNQKPDFISRSQKIISEAKEFFTNKGISTHGVIVGDIDYEDEEIQNIKIVFSIQDLDVSKNLELSKELITYLAGIDKDALSNIKIQLQPT